MYKLNILVNCYNFIKPESGFSCEMTWMKNIELPFIPFLGLEIIEKDKFIVELKKFNKLGKENTLTYEISTGEFSYWNHFARFNISMNGEWHFSSKERLIEFFTREGYELKFKRSI